MDVLFSKKGTNKKTHTQVQFSENFVLIIILMELIPGYVELNQRLTILEEILMELSTKVTFLENEFKKKNNKKNKNKKNNKKKNKKNKKKKYLHGRPPRPPIGFMTPRR